ncbi:MAG: DNA polymerase ligase N-terminal domain-containing protein [Sedimentisphaerales bacterium]|jgi:hypothetical protein|nr:DNA polymerase ligase N-terminal domain-containing protein [Sedimentisphaerales bacterium]
MPRFVIQQHDSLDQPTHWDLMFEVGDCLKTFRLASLPNTTGPIDAVHIHDHPVRFLYYQGPVNQGRGQVRIVDSGTYKEIQKDRQIWIVEFSGRFLQGRYQLAHTLGGGWTVQACATREDAQC